MRLADRVQLDERHARLLATGDPRTAGGVVEATGVRSDGREFAIEISSGIWGSNGEQVVASIIRDVSIRHRAEQKLGGLLESAPDAIVIANRDGEIVLANARAEAIFGYTREELVGSSVELLMPEQKRDKHAALRRDYADNPRPRHGSRPGEFTARRKDGSVFAAEITLNPIETDEGLLVSSAIRDVTDRRRADEATARLAAIVTSSPNAIIGIGTDARIESWNAGAQQLYGHTVQEAIGQPITILNPSERSQNRSHVDAALAGETRHVREPRHQT